MRLLLEKCEHGWSAHVLDFDIVSEGVDVWHAVAMAHEAVGLVLGWDAAEGRNSADRAFRTPNEAWEAFEAAIDCGLCEWCGRLCPRWSAMCRKCAASLGGLPDLVVA